MPDGVTKVAAGAVLVVPGRDSIVIQPACSLKTGGGWYCVTHEEWFANQLQKDIHIGAGDPEGAEKGKHVLAWDCDTHGMERP